MAEKALAKADNWIADIQKSQVTTLKENLKEMPKNMHLFSLSLRSLCAKKAVGTSKTDASRKFRQLRDDTRQDAILYSKCHLPITKKLVSSIEEYFEYYEALSYEEWCEMLPDIRKETTDCKEVAKMVLEMYEEMIVSLKKRESEAKIIMKEFTNLQQEYEKQKEKLETAAERKDFWAFALLFVPVINLIAYPLLKFLAKEDMAKAITKKSESDIQEAAVLVVAETLIPALSNFVLGLTKAAGFFEAMETELKRFEGKAEKSIQSSKRGHYMVMRNEAKEMKSLCQTFYAILPDVRTDFMTIPNEDADQTYVDKWLEEKMAEIQKKKVQRFFLSVFKPE